MAALARNAELLVNSVIVTLCHLFQKFPATFVHSGLNRFLTAPDGEGVEPAPTGIGASPIGLPCRD